MTETAKYLLKYAYDNFLKTGEYEYKILPQSTDNFVQLVHAAHSLQNDEYIEVLSNTLNRTVFTLDTNISCLNDFILWYKITDSGLDFIKSNL